MVRDAASTGCRFNAQRRFSRFSRLDHFKIFDCLYHMCYIMYELSSAQARCLVYSSRVPQSAFALELLSFNSCVNSSGRIDGAFSVSLLRWRSNCWSSWVCFCTKESSYCRLCMLTPCITYYIFDGFDSCKTRIGPSLVDEIVGQHPLSVHNPLSVQPNLLVRPVLLVAKVLR